MIYSNLKMLALFKSPWSILIIVVVIGFLLRTVPVFLDTIHFSFDQGLDVLMVHNLIENKRLSLISRYSGLQGVLMGPLWTWYLSPAYFLLDNSPHANVIWLSCLAVVMIVGLFMLFRKIIGARMAMIMALIMSISPVFVSSDQVVLSPHPLVYLFTFYIGFCYNICFLKKKNYLLCLLPLIGVFFQFEIAFAVFVLPTTFLIFLLTKNLQIIGAKEFWFGVILMLMTFIPQMIFDLKHNFLISKSLISFVSGSQNSLYEHSSPLHVRFYERIFSFKEDFISMALYFKNYLFSLLALFVSFVGWFHALHERKYKIMRLGSICIIILLTFFVGFTLYPGPIWPWYRVGLPSAYILLLVLPLGVLLDKSLLWKWIVSFILFGFCMYGVKPAELYDQFKGKIPFGMTQTRSHKETLDLVYELADYKEFEYYAYTPPVYDYIWQYNFWWYGRNKFGYLPQNWAVSIPLLGIGTQSKYIQATVGKVMILIVEPDYERPWNRSEWIKNAPGKELKVETTRSGVLVIKKQL